MLVFWGFVALCSLDGILAVCEGFKNMENFNASRHRGIWYGITSTYDWIWYPILCREWKLYATPLGTTDIDITWFSSGYCISEGYPDPGCYDDDVEKEEHTYMDGPERIIKTDYTSYSILYECDDNRHVHIGHVLTREQHPPQTVVDKALEHFSKHFSKHREFVRYDHYCWGSKPGEEEYGSDESEEKDEKVAETEDKKPDSAPSTVKSEEEKKKVAETEKEEPDNAPSIVESEEEKEQVTDVQNEPRNLSSFDIEIEITV